MNFMPATLEGGKLKLPVGEVDPPQGVDAGRGGRLVAGIRPESFEDAALVDADARDRGTTFRATISLVESMGSEQYAYFETEGGIESEELAELAKDAGADAGTSERHTVVARLDAASRVSRGEEAELWVDTSKLHLFDAESGERL